MGLGRSFGEEPDDYPGQTRTGRGDPREPLVLPALTRRESKTLSRVHSRKLVGSMKTFYRAAIVAWLISGFAIHIYFNRAVLATSPVESRTGVDASPSEKNGDTALRIREARSDAQRTLTGAYGAWALTGFVLAIPTVRAAFRHADGGAEIDKFLTANSC